MRVFPPEPANLDWSTVTLTNLPQTNGHVEVHYSTSQQTWSTPQLVQNPYLRVHGLAPGLNYGQQCYEGMKAFRTQPGGQPISSIHIFRPQAHAARQRKSAALVLLPQVPEDLFLECVRMAVAANAEFVPPDTGFLYLRPVLFGAGPQLTLRPPEDIIFAVYVAPLGGNYAPVWPFSAQAAKAGFALTLHLDSETRSSVEEFSTSGFVGLVASDGKREVHVPDTPNAVRSVTSDSLLALAQQQGWKVHREKITFAGLDRFSQVFAVGTGATTVPVRSITRPATGEKYDFSPDGPGADLANKLLEV
ncbi:aminotransferase [Aspergillus alliaceus]|uniref:aminotransferase n=1 Tax=Petromyces alliaceus TaxID=209559 RepID=UPI0012A40192|nr:aminotransferase [Aspergillus alliaceus]KAB8228306.1 aminotransferase [Aspergillus alliaceus]